MEWAAIAGFIRWLFNGDPHFAMLAIFNAASLIAMYRRINTKNGKFIDMVRETQVVQGAQDRRIEDHADFFDIIRADVDRAIHISTTSNDMSTRSIEMIISLLKKKR